jgi:hypothetical protein
MSDNPLKNEKVRGIKYRPYINNDKHVIRFPSLESLENDRTMRNKVTTGRPRT